MTDFKFNPQAKTYDSKNAMSLGLAAKLAYAGADFASQKAAVEQAAKDWGFTKFRAFSQSDRAFPPVDTQAFVMGNDQIIVTAFRGTEPNKVRDWLTDAKALLVAGPKNIGQIHKGFGKALNVVYRQISDAITGEFQDKGQTLWFTGHSLGAALATLMARQFQLETGRFPSGIYTFGQPRTGDLAFAQAFDSQLQSVMFRFVNNNDIVPHLPPDKLVNNNLVKKFLPPALRDFKHVGVLKYFNSKGNLLVEPSIWDTVKEAVQGAISDLGSLGPDAVNDHSMDNYLSNLQKNL